MLRRSLVLLALVLLASTARAGSFSTFGPHFGFSATPNQVVGGMHLQMGDVAPQLDFVPSADLGVGDGITTVSINGDFHYRLPIRDVTWSPYVGGGATLIFASGGGASASGGGGSFIFGADVPTKSGSRFFVEGKLGFSDNPTFKALAGWSFKMK